VLHFLFPVRLAIYVIMCIVILILWTFDTDDPFAAMMDWRTYRMYMSSPSRVRVESVVVTPSFLLSSLDALVIRRLSFLLHFQIELLLSAERWQVEPIPVSVPACNAETNGDSEVSPEPLSEFSGDGCDRHT